MAAWLEMLASLRKTYCRYLVAIAAAAFGTMVAFPIQAWTAGRFPFITFFPILTLVPLVAGAGPGLLFTFLSGLIVETFWMRGGSWPLPSAPEDLLALTIYLFVGVLNSIIGEWLRNTQFALQSSEESLQAQSYGIEASEARLRMAQDAGGVATFEYDVESGKIEGSELLFGILDAPAGVRSLSFDDLGRRIHPEDRDRVLRSLAACIASPDAVECADDYRLQLRSGAVRWVSYRGRLCRDSTGRAVKLMGAVADVTNRKVAEIALQRSEANLRLLADAGALLAGPLELERSLAELARLVVPRLADWCAVDMLEEGGALKRVAAVHSDPEKSRKAHELHERFPANPATPGGTWEAIRTGKTSHIPVITDEFLASVVKDEEHLKAIRELRLRSYVGVPLVARGRVLGVLTLVYSESGRTYTADEISLAEELARRAAVAADNAMLFEAERAARNEAERASRLKDDFLATLSHELRTPLNSIVGWSQLIARGFSDQATLNDGIAAISRNAKAQAQLIEDLLDMSRISSGKLRLTLGEVSIIEMVSEAIASVRPSAEAKHITIDQNLDPHAGTISGDASRLQQVVWNLLSNAVKFTPTGGKIGVEIARRNSQIEITVRDTGQGMKPEFLSHIFERFRQADSSASRRHGGLGIGLALVKQLVELHGGHVVAASEGEGRGSTFTITLPINAPRSEAVIVENSHPAAGGWAVHDSSLKGINVLVVDDEADTRSLAKRILEDHGAAVTTASSANEGFSLLKSGRPSVLLSDIGLPEHDGYELISWVRGLSAEEGGRTPAAAFTAFARSEDRQRALRAGFHSHLTKPVEAAKLVSVVADLAALAGTEVAQPESWSAGSEGREL